MSFKPTEITRFTLNTSAKILNYFYIENNSHNIRVFYILLIRQFTIVFNTLDIRSLLHRFIIANLLLLLCFIIVSHTSFFNRPETREYSIGFS